MAEIWDENEDLSAEEELVVTNLRDDVDARVEPDVATDEGAAVETTAESPRSALDELGEDVSSSPARRGHGDIEHEDVE